MRIDAFLLGLAAFITGTGLFLAISFLFLVNLEEGVIEYSAKNIFLSLAASLLVCVPCCICGGCFLAVWTGLMERRMPFFRAVRCDFPMQ
jgi:hypothetical protein